MRIATHHLLLACAMLTATAALMAGDTHTKSSMPTNAQEYLNAFRRGEGFTRPANGLTDDGHPSSGALRLLGEALATDGASEREKIVDLLVQLGLQTDALTPKGAETLRDPKIIGLLAGPGLLKHDAGQQAAMDALRKLVTQSNLAPHGEVFVRALAAAPSEDALLLVAKAKPPKAKEVVEHVATLPRWRETETVKIAQAALGDRAEEDKFLAKIDAAADAKELAHSLGPLGLIGTPRCLTALAQRLRTPLIYSPGPVGKSVRLNVLEALLYNFPDQPVLFPNNIITDEDYAAAERFCTNTFHVIYTEPRPRFLTYENYPSPGR